MNLTKWKSTVLSQLPAANILTRTTMTMATVGDHYETDEIVAVWRNDGDYTLPERVFSPDPKNIIRTDGNAYALGTNDTGKVDMINQYLMCTAIMLDGTLDPNWYLMEPATLLEHRFELSMVDTLVALHAVNQQ